jgi:Fe(3+) dicitrate transport protein
MKKLLPLFGLLFSLSGFTQISFSGIVYDHIESSPIVGAYITMDDYYTTSDRDGRFSLIIDSCFTCQLTITFLGYVPFEWNIPSSVSGTNHTDFGLIYLVQNQTLLKEVKINSTSLPYKGNFAGTNYYISPAVFKEIQPLSTEELLRTIPGVNVVGDMGLSNRPNISIRGSWGRRSEKVLLLEDGSPISPAPYIAPGIYYNPISDRIDAVEVYTGADILQYGPNNMYGIINYLTPKPPQVPQLRAKIVGGQRGFFTGLLSYGGTWDKVGAQVEAVYKRFDGFVNNSSVEMVNLNAKIYTELSKRQSFYFKVSAQFEDNRATLSSITPFTFNSSPIQNPFDADRFTMHRYGMDIIHKYLVDDKTQLSSKIFASDFARDWWRQDNAIIKAADARNYLGDTWLNERYSYLDGLTFGDEDFIRVGRVRNGRESTTDSRWHFSIAGIEEHLTRTWQTNDIAQQLDMNLKLHFETYTDMVLRADSSRWARSGQFIRDIEYGLFSISGFVRYRWSKGNIGVTPIVRVERVWMDKADRLITSQNPNITNPRVNDIVNNYTVVLPGATIDYTFSNIKIFASAYQGYIAPSKNFAFLVERDGIISNPEFGEVVNMQPELNINLELGMRGQFVPGRIEGQVAIFRNRIRNFYLAGWNEFFDKLGRIQIIGLESALKFNLLSSSRNQQISIQPNITWMYSRVLSGELLDRHLFSNIVHSVATKEEFVLKHNNNPNAFRILRREGQEGVITHIGELTADQVEDIVSTTYLFGPNYLTNHEAPYTPRFSAFVNTTYRYKRFSLGMVYNYVGAQFTEFANFMSESADGSIGQLDAFRTWDIHVNYDWLKSNRKNIHFFLVAKNIENRIFKMSRLNRANSGIFPGGFRQINAGVTMDL